MTPAEKTAALFASTGTTWQDRPVRPPAYVPDAAAVQALYEDLFAKVLEVPGPNVAQQRNLRVRVIKAPPPLRVVGEPPPPTPPLTYALEATPDGTNFVTIAVVDSDGVEVL